MRSRYTAFVLGDEDHLFRTWHPRTRPSLPLCDPLTQWVGLTVHESVGGGEHALPGEDAVVEFTACYRQGRGEQEMRERSLFTRRAGRWVYVSEVPAA